MTRFLLALGALFWLGPANAWATTSSVGDMVVENPWARESAGMTRSAGAFLTLRNTGKSADQLVSVASPVAGTTMLHETVRGAGMMKMRHVPHIDIGPGETVALQPGGLHVMLMKLGQPLLADTTFPLTLTFKNAGSVTIQVPVRAMRMKAPMKPSH